MKLVSYLPVVIGVGLLLAPQSPAGEINPGKCGAWRQAENLDTFEINGLPYQSWPFLAGCGLAAILGLGWLLRTGHRRRLRWIQASERELARRVVERTRELQIEIEQRQKTEEALSASLARIRDAHQRLKFHVERMPLAYIARDRDSRVVEWNPAAERIFGWTADEALGKRWNELIVPPEAQADIAATWASLLDGGDTGHSVTENRTKDGTRLFCEWFNTPLRDDSGTVVRVLSMVHDTTEGRTAQEQQRRDVERTAMLLDLHHEAPRLSDCEIYAYVLEKAVSLTSSQIGHLHQVSDDQNAIALLAWSQGTVDSCATTSGPEHPLAEAGKWADSAREKRPVVHNTGRSPSDGDGFLNGHTPVRRHLSVPVLDGDRVRLILGVGNKPDDYDQNDIIQLQLVANELHKVISARRAEESLRESEARNRGLLQAIPDLILVIDRDGVFRDFKPGIQLPPLVTPVDFLGKKLEEVLPFDLARRARERIEETLRTGELQTIEYELTPAAAEAPRAFFGRMSPSGQDQVLLLIEDVTERKRADEERASLFTAIEQAAESVIVTDTDGTIRYCNPAVEQTTGYSRAELIGKTPRVTNSGKHDGEFYRQLWSTIKSGQVWSGHFTNKRKDGSLFEEDATISPIHDADGKITGFVAVKRDVTRQAELEVQLRQAQKLESIGRLAGGVAHDFNNLLTVINGYSDLMQSRLPEGRLRDWLAEIRKAGSMAGELTQQLLAFSRKRIVEPKPVDLNHLVADTRDMLRRLVGEDIELETLLPVTACMVLADPGQLHQVLMNLAVNARDAMPHGGRLTIQTSSVELDAADCALHPEVTPGRYVRLEVTDSGTGMDDETKQHIFEPFFTTKDKGVGTGLGLATVYGIVRQCGGSIRVRSNLGRGSTFQIFLPQLDTPAREREAAPDAVASRGSETILVVEDQDDVRRLTVEALQSYGFRVLETASGGDALVLAERYPGRIHLVLTDVVMPHMTGKELAERLVALRPGTRVLYMSGYAEDVIAHHGVLEPGVDFIPKPFSPNLLAKKVREMLNRGEARNAQTGG